MMHFWIIQNSRINRIGNYSKISNSSTRRCCKKC